MLRPKSTHTHGPQGVNYRGYLHVLKYLLLIIIILKEKGVMQMNRLADSGVFKGGTRVHHFHPD